MVALQAILEALLFTSKQRLHGVSFQFVSRPSLVWQAHPNYTAISKNVVGRKAKSLQAKTSR